ncbi:lysine--tRNA ligase [Moritella dasanensis]|uniref:lysine--tRNA ligase n=1 Tax=Moritella dasanensis TaxID=428031 RepID=UPI0002DE804C|nr:lysine--tRNA ligase [Moritella dasanensis]
MSETIQNPEIDFQSEVAQRHHKLAELQKQGNAFPNTFRRDSISNDLLNTYGDKSTDELAALKVTVKVAGRIMTRRIMGKASFVTLQDMGGKIQLYVSRDNLPENFYNEQFKKWDIGDIVGAEGYLFKTQTGELSLKINNLELLTKALRPLPNKFHGLAEQETRYRQRYLDLIANEDARKTFMIRSQVIAGIRNYLLKDGFMEVETPMMQVIPGGASARPFITKHNALDMDMYLRVSPELYLKRLVVGGFERVFEINRNFRNEGISTRHNPEFTMLEFYMAYADYKDQMALTEGMLRTLSLDILGSTLVPYGDDVYDFGKEFDKISMIDSVLKYNLNISAEQLATMEGATAVAQGLGIKLQANWGRGRVITEIFEETVEEKLIQPTFITEYPAEVSPLARSNDNDNFITDRFEFFIGGREIANGYSELNDSADQDQRFRDQVTAMDAGDDEAMFHDADFITALEHGLPPTAGQGIGIDRLVMLFTNSHTIRDVILFPTLRPQN